ncbi:hypothetical protein LIER_25250 [Lithospermum erythrorhizon]|uniref:Retroviral polymerase SH3-like domain-containing protein n=1 Tax=Lithospermum erythrorhizon TaxID=34254 RepID=A0AAV3R672_LITER
MNTQLVRPIFVALRPLLLSESNRMKKSSKLISADPAMLLYSTTTNKPSSNCPRQYSNNYNNQRYKPKFNKYRFAPSDFYPRSNDYAKQNSEKNAGILSLTKEINSKYSPRSLPCLFLGLSPILKGYKCYNSESKRVLTSRHVTFCEQIFPYQSFHPYFKSPNSLIFPTNYQFPTNTVLFNISPPPPPPSLSTSAIPHSNTTFSFLLNHPNHTHLPNVNSLPSPVNSTGPDIVSPPISTTANTIASPPHHAAHNSSSSATPTHHSNSPSQPSTSNVPPTHPMITRSRNGISKPKHLTSFSVSHIDQSSLHIHT